MKEFQVDKATLANGAVWDLVLSEDKDQRFIFVADGANGQISALVARRPANCSTNGAATAASRGSSSGCTTSRSTRKGNLYTAEVGSPRRSSAEMTERSHAAAASAPVECLRHRSTASRRHLIGAIAGCCAWTRGERALRDLVPRWRRRAALLGFHAHAVEPATGVI